MNWKFSDSVPDLGTEKGRVLAVFQDLRLNATDIARQTGLKSVTISDIAKPEKLDKKPGKKFYSLFLKAFPQYCREWIEEGKGAMKRLIEQPDQNKTMQPQPQPEDKPEQITEKQFWKLEGKYEQALLEIDWYRDRVVTILEKVEQKTPSDQHPRGNNGPGTEPATGTNGPPGH